MWTERSPEKSTGLKKTKTKKNKKQNKIKTGLNKGNIYRGYNRPTTMHLVKLDCQLNTMAIRCIPLFGLLFNAG